MHSQLGSPLLAEQYLQRGQTAAAISKLPSWQLRFLWAELDLQTRRRAFDACKKLADRGKQLSVCYISHGHQWHSNLLCDRVRDVPFAREPTCILLTATSKLHSASTAAQCNTMIAPSALYRSHHQQRAPPKQAIHQQQHPRHPRRKQRSQSAVCRPGCVPRWV